MSEGYRIHTAMIDGSEKHRAAYGELFSLWFDNLECAHAVGNAYQALGPHLKANYTDSDGYTYAARVLDRFVDGDTSVEVTGHGTTHVFPLWVVVGAMRMAGWTVERPKGGAG